MEYTELKHKDLAHKYTGTAASTVPPAVTWNSLLWSVILDTTKMMCTAPCYQDN
jgi:hypothetical protein